MNSDLLSIFFYKNNYYFSQMLLFFVIFNCVRIKMIYGKKTN